MNSSFTTMTNATTMLSILFLAVTTIGCQSDDMLASRFVTSASVNAAGGIVQVTEADSVALAGTTLTIPAGALTTDIEITVSTQGRSLIDQPASSAGPVVVFGPAGLVFDTPATVTIPYDPSVDPGAVFIQVVEENGDRFSLKPVAMDAGKRLATIRIDGFTGFEPGTPGGSSELCDNGIDDDGDGLIDCDDPACSGLGVCGGSAEECNNGIDDDGDGAVDCADVDCQDPSTPACGPQEDCSVVGDEDSDGASDCDDTDCQTLPMCSVNGEICGNGLDDDGDGDIDCDDIECQTPAGGCNTPGGEICGNGFDDDGDGFTDCDDSDCQTGGLCTTGELNCNDGLDDDNDGLVDCDDPDCQNPAGGCTP